MPDFPGVFTGGGTLDEALSNVQDAVETFFDGEERPRLPEASPLDSVLRSADAEGGAVVLVDISLDFLDSRVVPVNISMPAYMRDRIGKAARARGLTRSAFLVQAARAYGA